MTLFVLICPLLLQCGHLPPCPDGILGRHLPAHRHYRSSPIAASHIVPWAECEDDSLRLNVYNGLLLSSLWDAAFDSGLISFNAEGVPVVSPRLSDKAAAALRLDAAPILHALTPQHELLLKRHRQRIPAFLSNKGLT
jgi:hypothetical protein